MKLNSGKEVRRCIGTAGRKHAVSDCGKLKMKQFVKTVQRFKTETRPLLKKLSIDKHSL